MSLYPEENISKLQELLGDEFSGGNEQRMAAALNMSGGTKMLYGSRIETNKRLAIFGDTVMTRIMGEKWLASGLEAGNTLSHLVSVLMPRKADHR